MKRRKKGKAMAKVVAKLVERTYFDGFGAICRKRLAPVKRNGRDVAPNPTCVRRILKDERPSRAMAVNIFKNAPELLEHPLTSADVMAMFKEWRAYGTLPEGYGRGNPPKRAADCEKSGFSGVRGSKAR